jgi:hypothetical protein
MAEGISGQAVSAAADFHPAVLAAVGVVSAAAGPPAAGRKYRKRISSKE